MSSEGYRYRNGSKKRYGRDEVSPEGSKEVASLRSLRKSVNLIFEVVKIEETFLIDILREKE